MMNPHTDPIPDWILERYALGELPPGDLEAMRKLVEVQPELRKRLAALAASDQEILERHPTRPMAAAIEERYRLLAHPRPHRLRWAVPLAATIVALFIVAPRILDPEPVERPVFLLDEGSERPKGLEPAIRVYRKEGNLRLDPGSTAFSEDLLQVAYVSGGRTWGAVLSLDGRGVVTLHLPEEGIEAVRLSNKGEVNLPQSYELDDAPAYERFFLVCSDQPFDLEPVMQAIRDLGTNGQGWDGQLVLPPAFHTSSLAVRKEMK